MKKIIIVISMLVILILLSGGYMFMNLSSKYSSVSQIKIEHMDLSKIPDGTYTGVYTEKGNEEFINYELKITVKNHIIENIIPIKNIPDSKKVVSKLIDSVIKEQKNDIDTITGASVTSKLFLKALENGLKTNK